MKLLNWMRTRTQNGLDPSKDFKGGFGCLGAQISSDVQDIRTNSFSFSGPSHDKNLPKFEEKLRFDEDGFCGFLAIGTLGTDPETPKFSATFAEEDVTGEKKEMAKLITEKLDKFLKECPEDISSKPVERSNAKEDKDFHACPQQDYDQFPSSIELTERSNGRVKKKKSLLTSLFKRTQPVQGESSIEKHGTKDVIKKVFEKIHGASSKKARNDDEDSKPKKKDLIRKSAQTNRRKVHPVLFTPIRDHNELDDRRKVDLKVPSLTGGFLGASSISDANRKREKWIKTDTEYLVLEL
ncbi:PREDICTED: protein LAZY 1-like [Camelina sativa]|uniref:Protein LAZY 1-like n=1 Tax=Camelina sativa TaxID=90675 RepID=A0ABM0ZDW1_CAMSA|nr:PREDICTED: protein LAZY 1-like [Camelina sativa]